MLATLILGASLLSAVPERAAPSSDDLKAYEAARAKLGGDADAHVKLALWCEQHGLSSERTKHLALAVLTDPKNVAARGLLGLVDYAGRWEHPDSIAAKVKADEALAEKLAEYNRRRDAMRQTADAHAKLALWCEQNGLEPEAKAHLASVVRLDPSREAAWKKLGMKRVNGRWVSPATLAREKAEAEAQRVANQQWRPRLVRWRESLHGKNAAAAREWIDAVEDPRSVPSIWTVFATGDAADQEIAARLLGHIDGPAANRALTALGVYSDSAEVRRAATEILRRRDGRDFVGLLIGLIREPVRYEVRPSSSPDLPGELFVEGESAIFRRVYGNERSIGRAISQIPPRLFDDSVPFNPLGEFSRFRRDQSNSLTEQARRRDADIAERVNQIRQGLVELRQQQAIDVATIEANNAWARGLNDRAFAVLLPVAGKDAGGKPDDWKVWWADQQGYVYERPTTPVEKPIVTRVFESSTPPPVIHTACFAAGTPVRTLEGLKPIETIQVGDRVLSQDVTTGALGYSAVLVPIRNKPAATFRLKVGNDEVVATAIHRFWKAGHGWAMTRDLNPGDVLRTAGGLATVGSIEPEGVQAVFNLEVAEGRTYFVGESSLLVHDHTAVFPVTEPFDAPVALAEIGKAAE